MKHLHVGAVSGVLAAASVGVVFAWRNASTANAVQYLQAVQFRLGPVVVPTSAQEVALEMKLQSVFSANYTGGTDVVAAVRPRILDVQHVLRTGQLPSTAASTNEFMIANTGQLTAGGGDVIDTQPYRRAGLWHPATAAQTDSIQDLVLEWKNPSQGLEHEDPYQGCIPILPNTGFIVSLPVALGAAYTARFTASVDWVE